MDGGEVLNKLSSEVPIIVISGHQPPGELLDPRIRRWLTKPVSIDDLVVEIERPLAVG